MADTVVALVVASDPVTAEPAVQVAKGVLAQSPDGLWRELQATLGPFDQPGVGQQPGQVSQLVEAVGRLVVKQVAHPVDVHLGQSPR